MNMIALWFTLMILAWVLAAYVLWGTDIVVSREEETGSDEGRGG
ncbi:hypothetical protein [Rubrobacter taiwanensis]|jgi:hypothetical protein|nr:hypothetical protein [Rubrobacter taiwanensis]